MAVHMKVMLKVHSQSNAFRLAGAWLAASWLAACAGTSVTPRNIPELKNLPYDEISRVDVLEISPEMKQFIAAHVTNKSTNGGRAWSLAYAAMDPYLLDFDYDPHVTLTAREAFREKTGNCLTFSNMFIAMAREAGLDAWYRAVNVPAEWSSVNDTSLVSMHINAAVEDRGVEYVIDVSRRKTEPYEEVRRLSDQEAEAQYYNNLGVNALIDDDLATAYAYLKTALKTQPDLAYVWSNLGVIYRRNAQTDAAKTAYQTALELDPKHSVSLNNLYLILEEEGQIEAAEELAARVEKIRRNNPYYLHYLAEIANDEERYSDAVILLNRAIRLEKSEYRFHQTLAQSQNSIGQTNKARASLARAKKLAPPEIDPGSISMADESGLPDS